MAQDALASVTANAPPWPQGSADYRSLFNEAPVALLSVGTDGRIQLANRHALQLLGYLPGQLLGRPVLELYSQSPSGKTRARKVFEDFCWGAEIYDLELEMQRADRSSMWVSLTVRPIRDAQGRIVASCSMVRRLSTSTPVISGRLSAWASNDHARVTRSQVAMSSMNPATELARVLIKSSGRATFPREREIDWLQAAGNYVQVHFRTRSYLLRATMSQMEAKLDPRQFVRIHRSAIVNINSIRELRPWFWGDWHIFLHDATQLTLSRSYRKKLGEQLRELPSVLQ